jgi:hypothetical protein
MYGAHVDDRRMTISNLAFEAADGSSSNPSHPSQNEHPTIQQSLELLKSRGFGVFT